MLVAVVLTVLADPRPTGSTVADAVEKAVVAALVVLAATRARRWSLVVGAAIVAVLGSAPGIVAGCIALAVAAFLITDNVRDRRIGGAVGALVVVGSMHVGTDLGTDLATGLPTVAAAVACGVILVSGSRRCSRQTRRWCRRAGAVVAVTTVGAGAVAALSVTGGGDRVTDGIDAARRGISSTSAGDLQAAGDAFAGASRDFDQARTSVDAVWVEPATWIPVVGQNLRMVRAATASGEQLARLGATSLTRLDYDGLRRPEGGIDLAAVASFDLPARRLVAGLAAAERNLEREDSPWLLPAVSTRVDDLRGRTSSLLEEAELASDAIAGAPRLLGGEAPRRYLVLLGNPAELRDLGGHIGNWAELVFDQGSVHLGEVDTPDQLAGPGDVEQVSDPSSYPPSLLAMRPTRFPQNWGSSPDLPTVARLASELFEHRTGRVIDGVMYADAEAFAAFLSLTGPVPVPGTSPPLTLDASGATRFLTRDQYELFATETAANDATTGLVRDVFDRLTRTELPGPRELGDLFGPLTREGRFQLATTHAEDRGLLTQLGLYGAVPVPDGHDLFGVISRNANPSKIDAYLHRSTSVRVRWDPTSGEVGSTVRVRLENRGQPDPADRTVSGNSIGVPAGTNVTDLAILTPFELMRASVDGRPVAATPQWDGHNWRHEVRVSIPPGGALHVQFELQGVVRAGPTYRMAVVGQPLLHPGRIRVQLTRPDPIDDARDITVGGGPRVISEARDTRLEFDIDS